MSSGVFLSLLLILSGTRAVLGQCYYPNGAEAKGDKPCDAGADNSMCCAASAGYACLSNKLCSSPNGNLIRGSCTDQNWHAPECAGLRLGASTGGTDLISCFNSTASDTSYCCDHTTDCCDTGVGRFNILPSDPEVWARFISRKKTYSVVGTVFSATSTILRTDRSVALTSTTTEAASTTQLQAATKTTEDQDKTDSNQGDGSISTGVAAGIGLGAGLGMVMVFVLGFVASKLYRRRKQPKKELQPLTGGITKRRRRKRYEAMENLYHGAAHELPASTPPTHYYQHVQELPASPVLATHNRNS